MAHLKASLIAAAVVSMVLVARADDAAAGRRADQAALKPFAPLVGEWKGTGQPQRNSVKGAWRESSAWAWKLTPGTAALEIVCEGGKYLKSAVLRPGPDPKSFVLEAQLPDGTKRLYRGRIGAKDALVLNAESADGGGLARVTLTPLHETRFLLLLEGRDAGTVRLERLGEVGYTRQGVAFAAGDTSPVCIVTEGRGTIQVQHKGKTYWVCCTGCRDLFQEDPEAVLAEAETRRKAAEKK